MGQVARAGRGRAPGGDAEGFTVHVAGFDGPFELLLALVTARRLDITEVSLAQVTDDFVAHLERRRHEPGWDLSEASGFLVVAATLLDLKVAALLPHEERPDDPEELLRLEARDLLFARLLQYRAFSAAAARLGEALLRESAHVPRSAVAAAWAVREAAPLPKLDLSATPDDLAALAAAVVARAAAPTPPPAPPAVDVTHLHAPRASVPEQVALIGERLRRAPGEALGFAALVADAGEVAVVVGRFLALLEMFRTGAVDLDQDQPLTGLTVRWAAA